MPLMKNGSQASVGQNIRQLRKDDYQQRQAIAIALDIQRRARKRMADGGGLIEDDWENPYYGVRDYLSGGERGVMNGPQETRQRYMDSAPDASNMPFGTTTASEFASTLPYDPQNPDPLTVGAGLASIPLMMGAPVGRAASSIGKFFSPGRLPAGAAAAATRPGLATGATAGVMSGIASEAEPQQFWQQQEPVQRDQRALDRARAARDERERSIARQKELELENRIRQGDRKAEEELRKSQESKALGGIPSKEWLERFKINPGQWLNMAEPERQSVLAEINRQEQKEYQRGVPLMEQYPGMTAASAVTGMGLAIALASRGKRLQAQQALNFENKWLEEVAHAKDVIKSGKGGSPESEALRTLNNYQKELKRLKSSFSNEDFKTGVYGAAIGAEGTALPYEVQAWYNPSVLKDQLTSSEFPIRIGAGAFGGGLGAKGTSFAKGQPMFRNLPEVDTRILLGKGQPFANPFDKLFRRDTAPYIVDRPQSTLMPWLGAGAAAAGAGYLYGRNSGEGRAMGGGVGQIASRFLRQQPSLPVLGGVGAGLMATRGSRSKPMGAQSFDESGFIGADYARGGNIPGQYGFMHGAAGGRADTRPTSVKGGSYVIPADVVSGLGQGNSMAGAKTLNRMFQMGGVPDVPMPKAQKTPTGPKKYADGGNIPIQVSDGEFLIPPEKVAEIGQGDIDFGHDVLDKFVQQARQKSIQHLSSLPPPKGSEQSFNDGGDVDFDGGADFSGLGNLPTEYPQEQTEGEYQDDRNAYGSDIANRSSGMRGALRQDMMRDQFAYVPPAQSPSFARRMLTNAIGPMYGAYKRAGFLSGGRLGNPDRPFESDVQQASWITLEANLNPQQADAFSVARKLREQGVPEDEIWRRTMTFIGEHGHELQELDDSKATLKGPIPREPTRLRDAIDHPALFEAYPELGNSMISAPEMEPGQSGVARRPMGGWPSQAHVKNPNDLGVALHEADHLARFTKDKSRDPFPRGYEETAYLTGARRNLTEEQRRATPPWKTKALPGWPFYGEPSYSTRARDK